MADNALKNCPFCNGGAEVRTVRYEGGECGFVRYFVMCQSCDATGGDRKSKNAAIDAWNRRVENVAQ